jgi:hypothetical protein
MPCSRFLPLAALFALPLAACAPSGSYPSLAPRPGELGVPETARPPEQAAPVPANVDAKLAAQINTLVAQAQAGQAAFDAALPGASARVAGAGSAESESWIAAQEALSQLESARTPAPVALSELDKLARERSDGGAVADLAAIDAASDRVRALVDRQDAEINRLNGSLAAP